MPPSVTTISIRRLLDRERPPAHVDPTIALHERMHLVRGTGPDAEVLDSWAVDLRGW